MELCYNCNRYKIPDSTDWNACQCTKDTLDRSAKAASGNIQDEWYDFESIIDVQKETLKQWFAPAGLPRGFLGPRGISGDVDSTDD